MTFDPLDWAAFAAVGRSMVDDMAGHLATLRERPAWQPVPAEVREALRQGLPREGQGLEACYEEFRRLVLPYTNGNIHPRFWGWVQGAGDPHAMLAALLGAGLNPMSAGFQQSAPLVEERVIAWMVELMGFPADASGVLSSSGTMANLLGLAVARHARAGFDVREFGLSGQPPLTLYCSVEAHGWARRSAEMLGIGNRHLRRIPVDALFRMDLNELRAEIRADRASGFQPLCVIGTAGTVNTGAIDPLEEMAELCAGEGLWFHVDGAFGSLARWSEKLAPLVRGIERADSLAFDLHKWGSLPFTCGCTLTRHAEEHRAAFALERPYMAPTERGVLAGGVPFADLGIDLTRGFESLKAWLCFKTHGFNAQAAMIEQNVRQAQRLAALVEASPELELMAPVSLNVVCFRYAAVDAGGLDALNQEILLRLQESGRAVISSTLIRGRFSLRAAHVNHRSTDADFDELVRAVIEIGKDLT